MMQRSEPLPILLVVLDGLADHPYPDLGGRTPLEAAHTPTMDRLAAEGQSGFHYPLGPGRTPSTELVHFRFFGYDDLPFPGRACLEALGAGLECCPGEVFVFLALRRAVRRHDGAYRVTGGYGEDFGDAARGYTELDGWKDEPTGYRFEVLPLDGGEAVLRVRSGSSRVPPSGDLTDSDPFFFTELPVLRPRPLRDARDSTSATADALDRFLCRAAEVFWNLPEPHESSEAAGRLVVGKWSGALRPLPSFSDLTGLEGVSVASGRLMRGLSRLTGLRYIERPATPSPETELSGKLEAALELLLSGEAGFAHVHTKAADEAAHAGNAREKATVVEELDRGLSALLEIPPRRLVACVTADHCTPVRGRTVHWGDSVPALVRGPHVRADAVDAFGERAATGGTLGQLRADDVLPFLLCQAEQSHFLGARPGPAVPLGIPASGEPWVYRRPEPGRTRKKDEQSR